MCVLLQAASKARCSQPTSSTQQAPALTVHIIYYSVCYAPSTPATCTAKARLHPPAQPRHATTKQPPSTSACALRPDPRRPQRPARSEQQRRRLQSRPGGLIRPACPAPPALAAPPAPRGARLCRRSTRGGRRSAPFCLAERFHRVDRGQLQLGVNALLGAPAHPRGG